MTAQNSKHPQILATTPFCYMTLFLNTKTNKNVISFGDGNVSVNENRDILKFSFTLNVFYLRIKRAIIFNILLYIAIFYLLFIPVSFVKLQQLILSWYFFTKNLEMHCFKRRRHKEGNNYVRWLLFWKPQQIYY